MIHTQTAPVRSHASLMEEQLLQIPAYCREWTNFNPSDPGVTILENLTAFQLLQTKQLTETTDEMKRALLKLAGITPYRECPARLLLEPEDGREPVRIVPGQQFYTGDICFEALTGCLAARSRITGVFLKWKGSFQDCSGTLYREEIYQSAVFTEKPSAGMELYFVMDRAPAPLEKLRLYITVKDSRKRNPFVSGMKPAFADIDWQLYTGGGFTDLMTEDATYAFMADGELAFLAPAREAAFYEDGPVKGYVIRGRLKKASYDIAPRIQNISGFLFEARQQETAACVESFSYQRECIPHSAIAGEGFQLVFTRRQGESFFRRYEPGTKPGYGEGTFYSELLGDRLRIVVTPNEEQLLAEEIKIVSYTEKMMRSYHLGRLTGSVGQEIRLPAGHVVCDSFCLLVRYTEAGESAWMFARPGEKEDGGLLYELEAEQGRLMILDTGRFSGAELFIAGCAMTKGRDGNVRAGGVLCANGALKGKRFYNPAKGAGGASAESIKEAQMRMEAGLYSPITAVTASDYEKKALSCPGLCIHKAHAFAGQGENEILIAVKPDLPEPLPALSPIYQDALKGWLEQSRPLGSIVTVRQPAYARIAVRGFFRVKKHYENSRSLIEETIVRETDCRTDTKGFGQVLRLSGLYTALDALPCVLQIVELEITPQNTVKARRTGEDITPDENCLLIPGAMHISIAEADVSW